jgi:phage gp29-like protein
MWEASEGSIWINAMRSRAQRRFRFDNDDNLRMLTRESRLEGENLTLQHPYKFQRFVFGDEPETSYGVGLGRELYWPWWFKKNGIKFWLIFCDKFGSPTAVGKYRSGATPEEKKTLLSALDAIQSTSSIIIPEGMSAELMEAARSGTVNTYESLCNFMNSESTICILGQTASTQGTAGKLGNEQSQENVRGDLVKADADALCEALNAQVVRWLVDYNFPNVKRYPKMWIRVEDEQDLKPLAERDEILVRTGLLIGQSYFYETYGIPKPEEGEAVVAGTSQPESQPPVVKPTAEFAEAGNFTPEQHAIEDLVDLVEVDSSAALGNNEQLILQTLQSANSFDEAIVALLELYPQLEVDALQDVLERSLFNAEMHGRSTVENA